VFHKLLSYFLLRMSLAMYASLIDEQSSNGLNNDSENYINNKRQMHNKTQKMYPKDKFNSHKVNSILEQIHKNTVDDDSDDDTLFNPPPNPESTGVEKTKMNESINNSKNINMYNFSGKSPQPNNDGTTLDLNNYTNNYGDNKSIEEYYSKVLPNYSPQKMMNANPGVNNINNEVLLQKLNYMINLLEENQDEKTNNVTEEVILYSFLGIFIIFIVDSFARVGKYVR